MQEIRRHGSDSIGRFLFIILSRAGFDGSALSLPTHPNERVSKWLKRGTHVPAYERRTLALRGPWMPPGIDARSGGCHTLPEEIQRGPVDNGVVVDLRGREDEVVRSCRRRSRRDALLERQRSLDEVLVARRHPACCIEPSSPRSRPLRGDREGEPFRLG